MSNLFPGILTIFLCTVGYYYSWKFNKLNNYKIALLLLLVCGLILRFYTSADFFLHAWDERFHALVAKNLMQHPLKPTLYDNPILPYDFRNWPANHIWVHKHPLPLWTMALSMWMFGVNEIAMRLPSILLSTLGIGLTFYLASYFFNKKIGYLAAFFVSINGLIIELAAGRVATDHVDIFFLFFILLAIFFSIVFSRKQKTIYNILAGVSIGAAILSKWLPALIVLPIWLLIVSNSKNFSSKQIFLQFIILVGVSFLVFLPWQIYIFKMYPLEANWETGFYLKHLTEALDEQTGPFYYFIDRIRINYGELIYLPLLWFSWKTIKDFKDKKRLAIFIWFWIPFLFFSMVTTKMQAYILFTSPALFIMTAEFWYVLSDYKKAHKPKWLINLVLILFIALPIRYSIERIKPFTQMDRRPQGVVELKELNKRNIHNGILFNYDQPIQAMFYTNLTVYPIIPDKKVITDLIGKGYTIIINDDGTVPSEIKAMKGIRTESFSAIH